MIIVLGAALVACTFFYCSIRSDAKKHGVSWWEELRR